MTVLGMFGQRLEDGGGSVQIYKLPSGSTAPVRDGRPDDAGTAMIEANNLAMLCAESLRHLVASSGPGEVPSGQGANPYLGLRGAPVPSATIPAGSVWENPWRPLLASRFYIPHAIVDRPRPGGFLALRRIRVDVEINASGDDELQLQFAITPGTGKPSDAAGVLAYRYTNDAGLNPTDHGVDDTYAALDPVVTGRQCISVVLEPNGVVRPSVWMPCRPSRDDGPVMVGVIPISLWVGYLTAIGDNTIISISAYEWPNPAL